MKTRISISALVNTINGQKIGILNNRYLRRGVSVFSSIGGACDIIDHKLLEKLFETSDYESETDARFKIPNNKIESIKDILIENFTDLETVFDFSICRELEEELSTVELPNQTSPFLTLEQVKLIKRTISHSVLNYSEEKQTYRFFIYYNLEMINNDFTTLTNNKEIRILSEDEISKKITNDNIEIASNIC